MRCYMTGEACSCGMEDVCPNDDVDEFDVEEMENEMEEWLAFHRTGVRNEE